MHLPTGANAHMVTCSRFLTLSSVYWPKWYGIVSSQHLSPTAVFSHESPQVVMGGGRRETVIVIRCYGSGYFHPLTVHEIKGRKKLYTVGKQWSQGQKSNNHFFIKRGGPRRCSDKCVFTSGLWELSTASSLMTHHLFGFYVLAWHVGIEV